LVSIALLSSCSNDYHPAAIQFFENDTIPLKEKIEKVLETANLLEMGFTEEQSMWLQEYYRQRDYKPRWINDSTFEKTGVEMKDALSRSLWFGIPDKRLEITKKKKTIWVEDEIVLTAKTALILNDLNNGFMNLVEKKFQPVTFAAVESLDSVLAQTDSLKYDEIFLKQGPSDTMFYFIKNKLYNYCSTYGLDKSVYDMRAYKLDSTVTSDKARKSLVSKGYIKEEERDSLTIAKALKLFQQHNGLKQDGKVGANTATALNESTYNKALRTSLVMDRMRQAIEYPEKYIRINIPEYLLRYYVHDSLKRIHHVVVGKPENQTPELESKVRNIVVYPYWKVPYSIASKEILPALKNNVNYLARNHMKIYRHDHEVNPYNVNWKRIKENSFPYEVVQQPGPDNSLGIIKFEFYNNYSVYVHDSPQKHLFKTDVRAYSHGCMRCQDPVDLGKTILDYDSLKRKRNDITADSLDSLITVGENYIIKLKDPIPIFVEYNTVYADREQFIFYLDIYKRDEEYLKIMRD
jgi:murein L,D-transpeptidase YcbB/YkuD